MDCTHFLEATPALHLPLTAAPNLVFDMRMTRVNVKFVAPLLTTPSPSLHPYSFLIIGQHVRIIVVHNRKESQPGYFSHTPSQCPRRREQSRLEQTAIASVETEMEQTEKRAHEGPSS